MGQKSKTLTNCSLLMRFLFKKFCDVILNKTAHSFGVRKMQCELYFTRSNLVFYYNTKVSIKQWNRMSWRMFRILDENPELPMVAKVQVFQHTEPIRSNGDNWLGLITPLRHVTVRQSSCGNYGLLADVKVRLM